MEFYHKDGQSIKSLIELGANGFFPLFEENWFLQKEMKEKKLTGNEKVKAKKLFSRVAGHRGINRKKTILLSMTQEEKTLFMRAFMKMVEMKIMDSKPGLQ